MTVHEPPSHTDLAGSDGTTPVYTAALTEMYRALKAIAFYPAGHPLREKILHRSYLVLADLTNNGGLSLVVQRNGLVLANPEGSLDNNPSTIALAKELFSREIQRLTFLPDLTSDDFIALLELLALEPQKIVADGGLAVLLAKHGIRSVNSDEIDISAVFTKKKIGESSDSAKPERDAVQEASDQEIEQVEGDAPDRLNELSLEELLALITAETDDTKFRHLARGLQIKGQSLKAEEDFDRLYPVLFILLDLSSDESNSDVRRSISDMVFQQLAAGEMAEHLLEHLEDKEFGQQEFVYHLLGHLGGEIVDAAIRRLIAADNQPARNSLATLLLRIGTPAIPALIELLKDGRWQIVRIAADVLGEMKCKEAVKWLKLTVHHVDNQVRIETIRALAKIGGNEATAELIALLQDENLTIRKQAIAWLGTTRNQKALDPLVQLAVRHDLLGKHVDIRKEAVLAIGRIGNPQAIEPLQKLARKRHLLASDRHLVVQLLAIETIASLGGESAKNSLKKLEGRGGRIGRACTAALETFGQRTQQGHD
jgi:hypothetical protein